MSDVVYILKTDHCGMLQSQPLPDPQF